jgi:hypothetical protein
MLNKAHRRPGRSRTKNAMLSASHAPLEVPQAAQSD